MDCIRFVNMLSNNALIVCQSIGIPLYHSSMRCKSLHISLSWSEERILKRGKTEVTGDDDFVESLTHRYVKRPLIPLVIDQMTLFEYLTWFDYNRSSSVELAQICETPLQENPLWRTEFNSTTSSENISFASSHHIIRWLCVSSA